ncbi:UNVERIFIED_CONTAM: Sugar transporter ERD6-like 16 [Sesamum latifolium]|uniref:Sugar transporter ERD6-like 16 n=1 Tax=Sesamum latifolium TaxID=2727402 RepID=A0AAW2XX90_9LAMI
MPIENASGELEKPFIQQPKRGDPGGESGQNGSIFMVLLSTFVAICGSFEFGICVGYSSPTQSSIRHDLDLSLSEFSLFGSIITIGAMFGSITSGRITDYLGRKGSMRLSAVICIAGWVAVYFSKAGVAHLEDLPKVGVRDLFDAKYTRAIILYIATFSIGMGAVPWVIMGEIFPIYIKGIAGSLVCLVHWSVAWLISYTFNFLMAWNAIGTFWIYAGFCMLTVLFVAKIVPETKGKTLEEIQAALSAHRPGKNRNRNLLED